MAVFLKFLHAAKSELTVPLPAVNQHTPVGPVQDEAVQAVLGMNQKHILYCPRFFQPLLCPKVFPSYLPSPSYLPTYLTSCCAYSIVRAWESLKWEDKRGRVELGARSGRAEVATGSKCLKWKGRSGRVEAGAKSKRAK
jgi:hypothetical protein